MNQMGIAVSTAVGTLVSTAVGILVDIVMSTAVSTAVGIVNGVVVGLVVKKKDHHYLLVVSFFGFSIQLCDLFVSLFFAPISF